MARTKVLAPNYRRVTSPRAAEVGPVDLRASIEESRPRAHFPDCGRTVAQAATVSCSSVLSAPGTRLRANSVYIVGTTKIVSKVPSDMPPTMTQPI